MNFSDSNSTQATFGWDGSDPASRHQYRFFRLAFELGEGTPEGEIHLFADTRYRLMVNGHLIGHGPARFKVSHPEYDSRDLSACLRPGKNVIAVVVCCYGWGTFLSDPSLGGLVAWGEARSGDTRADFSTPGAWRVSACTGMRPKTPLASFALGMIEDVDTRVEPLGWDQPGFDDSGWEPVMARPHKPWGTLHARTIPLLEESRKVIPQSGVAYDLISWDLETFSAVVQGGGDVSGKAIMVANLHADRASRVRLVSSLDGVKVNGRALEVLERSEDGAYHLMEAELRAGANEVLGGCGIFRGFGEWTLGWPRESGVRHEPVPGTKILVAACSAGEMMTDVSEEAALGALHGVGSNVEAREAVVDWTPVAMQRGWRTVERLRDVPLAPGASLTIGSPTLVVMDFCKEVLGRVRVVFEAPAGTVMIFAASERLNPDGTVATGMQGTRLLHRVIARGGRQEWMAMHPFGFRYLEVSVIPCGGQVTIQELDVLAWDPPFEDTGRFVCSDTSLNAVWNLCRETQVASLEDAYIDCPWRERGLYVGDQIIQYYLNLALFGDHTMMRRCVDLFFQGQDETGLLPPCSHRLPNWRHPDYSALMVESLWHYWARSGDTNFLREKRQALRQLLVGLSALRDPESGLVDGNGRQPYVDLSRCVRDGISFPLNAFFVGSFRLGASLFQALGDDAEAEQWQSLAEAMTGTLCARFLDPESGLFRDRMEGDSVPSATGNALALYYDIAPAETKDRVLAFVAQCAETNCTLAEPTSSHDFHFSAYSSFYALSVLYRFGRGDVAERFMRREWRRMLDGGAWTCWEFFVPSHSLCHAWAASPGWFLSAHVLGIRYLEPGNPDRLIFDPSPGSVTWAEGVLPHPKGPVRVRWRRTAHGYKSDISAPEGVVVEDRSQW